MDDHAFLYIGTHRVKEGKLDAYRAYSADFIRHIEEQEPQLHYFAFHLDETERDVTVVQVHPDADSMVQHMKVAREHIGEAYTDFLEETGHIRIYGIPSEEVLTAMRQLAGSGTPVEIHTPFDGFSRLGD